MSAARELRDSHVRSAVSRAYYAAHSILADALLAAGYVPVGNRQTPPHEAQPRLIAEFLAELGQQKVRELRATMRRLHAARLDADYNRRITVDEQVSLAAVRDAHSVFVILRTQP